MNKVLFSIVIPTYNRAELLKRCINSVISQTYSNWEAIVVDNYSSDNTEEVIKTYNDERIIYVKNHNYGIISISRNRALDMVKGDWVCFLDSDDCWYPNKLERMSHFTNEYDLIYHGYKKNIKRTNLFQKLNCYFYEIKEPTIPYVLQRGDPISPSCSCVSKKVIGDTRFSEDKSLIAVEDYDFFLQLIEKNIRVKYLREIYTLYDVNGCSHDIKGSERDQILIKKWEYVLNEREKKECKIQILRRKADFYRVNAKYHRARVFYYRLFSSTLLSKKIVAIKGLILCAIRQNFS